MKKLFALAAIALTLPLVLIGCGNEDLGRKVVLYSNAVSNGRGEWIQEHAAEAGFEVEFVDLGGIDLTNRLQSESTNPQADVVFGLNQIGWAQLTDAGIFTPYTPEWAPLVDSSLNNPDGYFHAVALMGNFLVYDASQLEGDAPTDWLDLWTQERFHGKYSVHAALAGSTVQMILSGIFNRFLDENGEMGLSQEGWDHVMAKFNYAHVQPEGNATLAFIDESNDAFMAQIWHAGVGHWEGQTGVDFSIVVPDVGIPFSTEAVGLVNNGPNPEVAKEFIDWFGSAEVMNAFALEFDYLPTNQDALDGLPEYTLWVNSLPRQEINWPVISHHMPQWLEHIILHNADIN